MAAFGFAADGLYGERRLPTSRRASSANSFLDMPPRPRDLLDEGPTEDGVEAALEQQLERRAGEINSGAAKLEPWSRVRQELDGIVCGS